MPRYVFQPANNAPPQLESGQTISRDDVTTILGSMMNGGSDLSQGIWDKVLLENTDDLIFVLSLKGLFLYLSPSCNKILEYEAGELLQTALSSICHPSDIVPVTRELKDTSPSGSVDIVFRIRRKQSGYMWFEARGSLHSEQGKGRKAIILVGRERPVYTLSTLEILEAGGIGENEIWSKLSTSGIVLFVANNVRQLLDRTPNELVGTTIQNLMRPESKVDFARILGVVKTGKRASSKHDIMNKRGNVLQAYTTLYPGDAVEGQKPSFVIAQTRLIKYARPSGSSSRSQTIVPRLNRTSSLIQSASGMVSSSSAGPSESSSFTFNGDDGNMIVNSSRFTNTFESATTFAGQHGLQLGHQDVALAAHENLFDELKTTRSTSWQFELRQMEKRNRLLAEELQALLAARKKRKRRKQGAMQKDCANCHTRQTPEWRRGPSGQRDLCNSCGLRYAKQQGRISPRTNKSAASIASGDNNLSPETGTGSGGAATAMTSQSPGKKQPSIAEAMSTTPDHKVRAHRASQGSAMSTSDRDALREQIDEDQTSNKAAKLERHSTGAHSSPNHSRRGSYADATTGPAARVTDAASDGGGGDAADEDDASGDRDEDDEEEDDDDDDDENGIQEDSGLQSLTGAQPKSGNPNSGRSLPHMVEENVAGEAAAMESADLMQES